MTASATARFEVPCSEPPCCREDYGEGIDGAVGFALLEVAMDLGHLVGDVR